MAFGLVFVIPAQNADVKSWNSTDVGVNNDMKQRAAPLDAFWEA